MRLIQAAFLISTLWVLACAHRVVSPDKPYGEVWEAETIRVLALDLREDGELSHVWDENVPIEKRVELVKLARELNRNAKGLK